MMSKTHIAVGVAASLAIMQPTTVEGCLAATMGGAIGGIICDIDTRSNQQHKDALYGRIIAVVIAVVVLAVDFYRGSGICVYVVDCAGPSTAIGVAIWVAFCLLGVVSDHRTFTHSLLALLVTSYALWLICPLLVAPYAIGFASHLVLDIVNKKNVQLFFPLKKGSFCLGLFYADGTANTVMMLLGSVVAIALFAWRLSIGIGV